MRRTILEAVFLLLLALCIALLYHSLSKSGITIFKKRQSGALPPVSSMALHGEALHAG